MAATEGLHLGCWTIGCPEGILMEPSPAGCAPHGAIVNHSGARQSMRLRSCTTAVFCLAVVLAAAPASAQYGVPLSDPATGETYHVEVGGYLWSPTPTIAITSESLGIIGSRIDFVEDLGIESSTMKQLKVVLRPG